MPLRSNRKQRERSEEVLQMKWYANLGIGYKLSAFGLLCFFGMALIILTALRDFGRMETISDFKERIHAAVKGAQDVRVQEKTYLQFYLPEYRKNLEDHARELRITLDQAAKSAGKAAWKEQIASIAADFDNFLKQFSEVVAGHDRAVRNDKDQVEILAYCADRIDKIISSLNNEHFQLQMEGGVLAPNKMEMLSVARDCKLFLLKLHTLQQTYLMTGDDRYSKEFAATLGGKDAAALSSMEQFAKSFKEKDKIEFSKEFNEGFKKFVSLSRENQDLYTKDKALAKALDEIGNRIIAQAREMLADATSEAAGVKSSAVTAVTTIVGVTVGLCLLIALIMIRSITLPLHALVGFSQAVAGGDFSQKLEIERKDEIGVLAKALRAMVSSIKAGLEEVKLRQAEAEGHAHKAEEALKTAEEAGKKAEAAQCEGMLDAAFKLRDVVKTLGEASKELTGRIESVSKGVEGQERRVAETATAMEEMNATVLEVARNASEAAKQATDAREKANAGEKVVERAMGAIATVDRLARELETAMAELGNQAQSIGHVMNVISDIADQTNLLALNAAIEAARAGEAGRGFAVVADEVRKLAEKTMTATKEVGQEITAIQAGTTRNVSKVKEASVAVNEATRLANESGVALREIVSLVDDTSDQVARIATASEEQSATSEVITRSVEEISQISSNIAQGMQESSSAVEHLADQAKNLENIIASFQAEGKGGGKTRSS